jgi:DNA repair protein RecO (recombination protein O)
MPLLVTDAIVLHVADYLESSRILRLATREAGVQSVVARGARSSRKRFGSAVDLFAEGQAQIETRVGRDLHTLVSFDVVSSNPGLAADLTRFSAASAIAECTLRVVHEESAPAVYGGIRDALRGLAQSGPAQTGSVAIGALWRLVRDTGYAPTLDVCAECHEPVEPEAEARFSHASGGILCARCGARAPGGRRLPPSARAAIVGWMQDEVAVLGADEVRAHQRLLREFLGQNLIDSRPMRAFASWENGGLDHNGHSQPGGSRF